MFQLACIIIASIALGVTLGIYFSTKLWMGNNKRISVTDRNIVVKKIRTSLIIGFVLWAIVVALMSYILMK